MNRNDFFGILEKLSKEYNLEIDLIEEPFENPVLMIGDPKIFGTVRYEIKSYTHSELTLILDDIKRKFNLKRRDDGLDAFLYSRVAYDKCFKPKTPKPVPYVPKIKNVIFNEPATIIIWADGTKTVVKCQDGEIFDPEKGLAIAISKKALGNMGNYCEVFKKWLPEEEVETERDPIGAFERFKKAMDGLGFTVEVVKEELENSNTGDKK